MPHKTTKGKIWSIAAKHTSIFLHQGRQIGMVFWLHPHHLADNNSSYSTEYQNVWYWARLVSGMFSPHQLPSITSLQYSAESYISSTLIVQSNERWLRSEWQKRLSHVIAPAQELPLQRMQHKPTKGKIFWSIAAIQHNFLHQREANWHGILITPTPPSGQIFQLLHRISKRVILC